MYFQIYFSFFCLHLLPTFPLSSVFTSIPSFYFHLYRFILSYFLFIYSIIFLPAFLLPYFSFPFSTLIYFFFFTSPPTFLYVHFCYLIWSLYINYQFPFLLVSPSLPKAPLACCYQPPQFSNFISVTILQLMLLNLLLFSSSFNSLSLVSIIFFHTFFFSNSFQLFSYLLFLCLFS